MKKVLLVESDMIVAKFCADDLIHSGYHVEVTTDSKMALSAIPRFKPDAIILDYFLKDLNAPEMLPELRKTPESESVPIIVLAPANSSASAEVARKAGAKFIPKSRGWDQALRAAVREALNPKPPPPPEILSPTPDADEAPALIEAEPPPITAPPVRAPAPESPLQSSGTPMEQLKALSLALLKSEEEAQQAALVAHLADAGHDLLSAFSEDQAGFFVRLARALVTLLDDLVERPQNIGPSSMRTIFQTTQSLGILLGEQGSEVASEDVKGLRVLAVDDDLGIRRLVTRALGNVDLQVNTAKDPIEAMDLASRKSWDLFILDVNMPKMSGFDLCAKLRALPRYSKTPVVFLTACNDIEHRLRFARSKADDFIAKPFLVPELNVKVLALLADVRIASAAEAKLDSGSFRGFKV